MYCEKKDRLYVDNQGILKLRFNGGRSTPEYWFGKRQIDRLVVPEVSRTAVMKLNHDAPIAGHMGAIRSWQRIRNCFWWPSMKQEIDDYVAGCDLCHKNKHHTHPLLAPLQKTDIPLKPLEKIQVDFVGPFSAARTHEYRYALQIQDILSRFLMFVPCVANTADAAAEAVMEKWLCVVATFPKKLTSDHGTHFTAHVFEAMCKLAGIRHKMGAPAHPESQGQVERQNQLLNQVRCLCDNNIELWPQALTRVQYSHNTSINAPTGIAPICLITGQSVVRPEEILMNEVDGIDIEDLDSNDGADVLRDKEAKIAEAIKRATQSIVDEQERRCGRVNETRTDDQYKVGQLVRYKLSDSEKGRMGGKKIAPRNSDLHRVVRTLGEGWTYEIETVHGDPVRKVRHFNELIPQRTPNHAYPESDSVTGDGTPLEPIPEEDNPSESVEEEDTPPLPPPARHERRVDFAPRIEYMEYEIGHNNDTETVEELPALRSSLRRRRPPAKLQLTHYGTSHAESREMESDPTSGDSDDPGQARDPDWSPSQSSSDDGSDE